VSQRVKIFLITVIFLLVVVTAMLQFSPDGSYYWQLFKLGVKHGVEDRQSGIKYGAEGTGWKVIRNGDWTSSEKLVAQRLIAEPPAVAKSDTSIFTAGYNCGTHVELCLALLVVVVAGTILLISIDLKRKAGLARK